MNGAIRKTDIVSRWGGEEILIYMSNCSSREAARIAEKLRLGIEGLHIHNRGQDIHVTMTFGVADSTEARTTDDIIKLADDRLYQGKENGKNKVSYH